MSKRRGWLVVGVVALIIALVAFRCRSDQTADPAETQPIAVPTEQPRVQVEAPPPAPLSPPTASDSPRVAGRVVIGRDGSPPESGVLWFSRDGQAPVIATLGAAGRFDVEVPEPGEWSVAPLLIDGEPRRTWWHPKQVTADSLTVITLGRSVWPEEVHDEVVVYAEAGATALLVATNRRGEEPHPDDLPLLAPSWLDCDDEIAIEVPEDGRVPRGEVDLSLQTRIFVRTKTTAWETMSTPRVEPLRMALPPAGTLALEVIGWRDLDRPEIVLMHEDGERGLLDVLAKSVVPGLRTGRWDVVVRRRPWVRAGRRAGGEVYAHGEFRIVAGETTSMRLEADRGDVAAEVAIAGRIFIPLGWNWEGWSRRHDVGVEVDGIEMSTIDVERSTDVDLHALDGGAGHRGEFRISGLPPGEYELIVKPLGWTMRVTAPAPDLDLQLPAPAELRVRVLDAITGEELPAFASFMADIDAAEVPTWRQERFGDYPGGLPPVFATQRGYVVSLDSVGATAALGGPVPPVPGTLHVFVNAADGEDGFSDAHNIEEIRLSGLRPGVLREITVRPTPCGPVRVDTVVGERTLPDPPMRIVFVGAANQRRELLIGRGLDLPVGTWRVEPDPVHGQDVVAPETIDVVLGETTTLRVELRPRGP